MKKALNLRGTMRLMKIGESFWVKDETNNRNAVKSAAYQVRTETGYNITTTYDKFRGRTLITREA